MTLRPVPFVADHVFALDLQGAQRWHMGTLARRAMIVMEGPYAFTLLDGATPIACAGVMRFHAEAVRVWALLSSVITGATMIAVHRWATMFINGLPFRRVEATVSADFPQAERWVRQLGFLYEGTMRSFDERGVDAHLYARVQEKA